MKTVTRLAVVLAALALGTSAHAQAPATASSGRTQLGLGIAIAPLTPAPTIEVYVPIQIAPNFRLEPSLGISTNDAPTGGTDTSDFTLGIGAFFQNRVAPTVDAYVGGRLKLNRTSFDDGVNDDSGTDVIIAGAIGSEYYFVPKFSIGLEGELGLYQNSEISGDDSGFFTTGLAFLRMYF